MSSQTFRQQWDRKLARTRGLVMSAPVIDIIQLAKRVISEQDATIAQLRSELDAYQGRTVLFCTEAAMDAACLASLDEPDGTILRATDTGRELVLADRTWIPR